MAVKIKCNRCDSRAIIQSSSEESDAVKKLYCSCSNPECGHSFVMELSFSHTLSPSALDFPEAILRKVRSSTRLEQRKLFQHI